MSSLTEGLCSPLASRVESVLHMNDNPIDLYGVASSLKFYLQIVIKVSLLKRKIVYVEIFLIFSYFYFVKQYYLGLPLVPI